MSFFTRLLSLCYYIFYQNFLFFTSSRPALRPTQPATQWVPAVLSLGLMRPGWSYCSPPFSAEVKYVWIYTSSLPYVMMPYLLTEDRGYYSLAIVTTRIEDKLAYCVKLRNNRLAKITQWIRLKSKWNVQKWAVRAWVRWIWIKSGVYWCNVMNLRVP